MTAIWDAPCTDCGADNIAFHTWCASCFEAHKLSHRKMRHYHEKRAELFDAARALHGTLVDHAHWQVDHMCGPGGEHLYLRDTTTGDTFASVALD